MQTIDEEQADQQALENMVRAAEGEEKKETFAAEYPNSEPPLEIPTAELVAQLLSVTFGIVAARRGKHWNLNADEASTAGEAYGAVLDKYFPDFGNNMGVEVTAVLVTGMLITPRLMRDIPKNKKVPSAVDDDKKSGDETAVGGLSLDDFERKE